MTSIGLSGCTDENLINSNQGLQFVNFDAARRPGSNITQSDETTGSISRSDSVSAPAAMALPHDEYEDSPKGDLSTAEFE
jgi:hypothetical protein